jgi:hypothetical protein
MATLIRISQTVRRITIASARLGAVTVDRAVAVSTLDHVHTQTPGAAPADTDTLLGRLAAGTYARWTWLTLRTALASLFAPLAHSSRHNAGGADALAIDAAAGTGSLRTLGTAATAACAGNDSRLSDARTPTAHTQADSTVNDPLGVDISGDVSAGAVTITWGAARRSQYADLGAASALTITAAADFPSTNSRVRLSLNTTNAGLTLTLPGSTRVSGTVPAVAGWHCLSIRRDWAGTLIVVYLPRGT